MRRFFLFLAFACGACSLVRISEQERFFKTSTNHSKVYIYTLSPSKTSSSQRYLCTLLLTHSTDSALSINTFSYTYDGSSQRADFTQSYTDSIQLLNESTFPINFIAANEQSASPSYFHSFKRNKIEFEQEDSAISSYEIRFSKQKPFQVIQSNSPLEISGTRPILAELHSLNRHDVAQESIVQVHTMDSIHSLFDRKKRDNYYWIDFGIHEEYGSLFFRLSSTKDIEILLNTFPSLTNFEITLAPSTSNPNCPLDGIDLKGLEGAYQVVPLKTVAGTSMPQQFWTGAVEIIDRNTRVRVGVGNLFVL